ncbi:DER2.1 [Scenedesmus sp. PABB004]|nr:DER2.1 [Scenedesmus sp. PABB004]
MFFLVKYCKSLEEGSFRGRSADFLWMLLFGGALLTSLAPFVAIEFLGSSLTFMMVYVWGRRHQYVNLSFLGIFNFTAPYLPWVLLAFSVMLGSSPKVDLLGMVAGHAYYFLEDVYPRMTARRPLKTPGLVAALFPVDEPLRPPPDGGPLLRYAPDELQQQLGGGGEGGEGEGGEGAGGAGEGGAGGAGAGPERGAGGAAAAQEAVAAGGGDGRPHAD